MEEINTDVNSDWMAILGPWADVNNERAEYANLVLNLKWYVGVEICLENTI